jgi:hypothetical protein
MSVLVGAKPPRKSDTNFIQFDIFFLLACSSDHGFVAWEVLEPFCVQRASMYLRGNRMTCYPEAYPCMPLPNSIPWIFQKTGMYMLGFSLSSAPSIGLGTRAAL